jgi:hypothetical protein
MKSLFRSFWSSSLTISLRFGFILLWDWKMVQHYSLIYIWWVTTALYSGTGVGTVVDRGSVGDGFDN